MGDKDGWQGYRWMHAKIDGWTEWIGGRMDAWLGPWMEARMDWKGEWMNDAWMHD